MSRLRAGKSRYIAVLLTVLMTLAVLLQNVPPAAAENLTVNTSYPECIRIEGNYFRVKETIDPANVHVVWDFSNGLDRPLQTDLTYISLKEKDTGREIKLEDTIQNIKNDNGDMYITAGDFYYTKAGRRPNNLRRLELILKSTVLKYDTNYLLEIGPGFSANNGLTLGQTYTWEFKTSAMAPKLVKAATNTTGTKVFLDFDKVMADPIDKEAQFKVKADGADNPVKAASLGPDPARIELALTKPVVKDTVITLDYTPGEISSADGGLLAGITGQIVTNNAPCQVSGQMVVDEGNKRMAVNADTPAATIHVPVNVTGATINVAGILSEPSGGTIVSHPLPQITVSVITRLSGQPVLLTIPAGAAVSAEEASGWDGTINLPAVFPNDSVTVPSEQNQRVSVGSVMEIGYGDTPLIFSKAVRILIPGQAGKSVGYLRGETLLPIGTQLAADTQEVGDALPSGGAGYINVGTDLVIWTKHFTKFVAYTRTPVVNGSNSGGSPGDQSGSGGTGRISNGGDGNKGGAQLSGEGAASAEQGVTAGITPSIARNGPSSPSAAAGANRKNMGKNLTDRSTVIWLVLLILVVMLITGRIVYWYSGKKKAT